MQVDNFLAFELVFTTLQLSDITQLRGALVPVVGHRGERIGKDAAIGCVSTPVTHVQKRNFVLVRSFHQRVGRTRRHLPENGGAVLTFTLEALVAFNRALGNVTEITLFPRQFDTINPTISNIQQGHVIHPTTGDSAAAGCKRPRPVRQYREKLLFVRV